MKPDVQCRAAPPQVQCAGCRCLAVRLRLPVHYQIDSAGCRYLAICLGLPVHVQTNLADLSTSKAVKASLQCRAAPPNGQCWLQVLGDPPGAGCTRADQPG